MEFNLEQIAHILNGELEGDGSLKVSRISSIEAGQQGSVTFLSNPKYEPFLYKTSATAAIVSKSLELREPVSTSLIRVDDPYASFTTLLAEYQRLTSVTKTGQESPNFIHPSAQIGKDVYVGAFAYIGEGAVIGDGAQVYPQTYVGDHVQIGAQSILYAGVKVYANCQIGSKCTVQSGAVLGSDGFGFAPQADGTYQTIPQLGKVIVEDHVDIGANTVVDCATFDATVIKSGVKLDNLIQVAHNVEIGENTVIAAQAGVSGSTKIGKQCVIGGQAGIVGHLKVADGTKIQAQSGMTKNTKPDSAWYGSPAIAYNNYVKSYAIFRKLPDVIKRLGDLEEKLLNLAPEKGSGSHG
ncbi:MAG: UDP-3-O-(3-hydroxymyristoyl)glucosamine N-acyltransferase [Cytophagales bacterium]|nr:UDP-3-O-(3-hydroxymyristoyl)glucosamine N-acyltransferase [Cytophagales bacterium]